MVPPNEKAKTPDAPEALPVKDVKEDVPLGVAVKKAFDKDSWTPKTALGKKVKAGEITDMSTILDHGLPILEAEIVDMLVPNLESDLIAVGQSKGKFGGGKRSIWRQTQKKTAEGNKPSFGAVVVVGNRDGYLGVGYGKARETMPAREKATRNAKINLIKIRRGCGSWECGCAEPHTTPSKVRGRSGSVTLDLRPAPKGANLSIEGECSKLLTLAGIKDIYSKAFGQTRTKMNLIYACFDALKKLSAIKIPVDYIAKGGVLDGPRVKEP